MSLNVVGEKKQLQGYDYKSLESQVKGQMMQGKKPHRMLKIKENSMKIQKNEVLQSMN